MKPFKFKKFEVHQDKAAMKIGTDSVLLGSWIDLVKSNHVLDIGTGTGILSLMIAQRNNNAIIKAIEIEKESYEQALFNFKNSSWSERLQIENCSLQNYNSIMKFDCIISNPPFYDNNHFSPDTKRTTARHTSSLTYSTLIQKTSSLLTDNGNFHTIIPYENGTKFIKIAQDFNLYPFKILNVRGNKTTPLKRSLLSFSHSKKEVKIEELIIEISRHNYTQDYINLTKEFYLKM